MKEEKEYLEQSRNDSVGQESELSTVSSFPAGGDLHRETLENELQKLHKENIKLKTKYKAAKNEVKHYQERLNEVESEIKLQAIKESKCVLTVTYLSFSPL